MTDRAASAEPWSNESMRLLDLYVRGFKPVDVARELVEKYRVNHPDVFDSNPAHTDEQLLASAEVKFNQYGFTGEEWHKVVEQGCALHDALMTAEGDWDQESHVIMECLTAREKELLEAHKEIARLAEVVKELRGGWKSEWERAEKAEAALALVIVAYEGMKEGK